jgi:hypothetical protein
MAKVQIFRQSGLPVEPDAIEAYQADFRAFNDKAQERAGYPNYSSATPDEKALIMRKLQRFLSYGERLVFKKHSKPAFENLPTSKKAWMGLCEKYGHAVIVAPRSDTGALVLVITDRM